MAAFKGKFSKLSVLSVIIFLLILTAAECSEANAQSASSYIVWGRVVDVASGQPIRNATVALWGTRTISTRPRVEETTLKGTAKTGVNGTYELSVNGDGTAGNVHIYYDDPASPGYDYLPKIQGCGTLLSGRKVNVNLALLPAASIIFEGDLLLVDSSRPPTSYNFTVASDKMPRGGSTLTYGTSPDSYTRFLGLSPNHVLVPANSSVQITVKATTLAPHSFVVADARFSNLSQGEALRVKIGQYSIRYNLNLTRKLLQSVEKQVSGIEQFGFYFPAEKQDLEKVSGLVQGAEGGSASGLYEESYANLREAYIKATYLSGKFRLMLADAGASTSIIIVFLALISIALSYLLFDSWSKKALTAGMFYLLFFAVFYNIYIGCRFIDTPSLLRTAGLAFLASFFFMLFIPRFFSGTTSALFSMAKRSLRGRKMRFMLTLTTVTALVMGFVAFTSFSTEEGFTSATMSTARAQASFSRERESTLLKQPQVEGLLIREPLPSIARPTDPGTQIINTFNPLETSIIDWLKRKAEVTAVAPKAENMPRTSFLGSLGRLRIRGILGISPAAEAKATGLDKLVVQGSYLGDDEADGVMISAGAAAGLNLNIGDRLTLSLGYAQVSLRLVGLLDDAGLSRLVDVDGLSILPEKLYIAVEDGVVTDVRLSTCDPSEVVLINLDTALSRLYLPLSRVDVVVDDSMSLLSFARQLALERDYWVWGATGGHINLLGLTSYMEAEGWSVLIPWTIVILNVVITMINSIYERRRESTILSAVGLNPAHISTMFGAEALVIGVLGGGVGYLLGLSLYRIMPLIAVNLVVRQKVSAVWSLTSVAVAVTAVLVGAFMALKFSVAITPSLLRKWKIEGKTRGDTIVFDIPVRVSQEDLPSLLAYVGNNLAGYYAQYDIVVDRVKQTDEETSDEVRERISFTCREKNSMGSLNRGEVIISRGKNEKAYTLSLTCKSSVEMANKTATFMRRFFLEWGAARK